MEISPVLASSYCLSYVMYVCLVFKVLPLWIPPQIAVGLRFFIFYCCLLAYDLLVCTSASLFALTWLCAYAFYNLVGPSCQVFGYSNLSSPLPKNIYLCVWGGVGVLWGGGGSKSMISPNHNLKLAATATSVKW